MSLQNEHSKSELSSSSLLLKTPEVESKRHTMAFIWLGTNSQQSISLRCLYLPVSQYSELGCDGENLEKLSMESTVLNMHYVIQIPRDFN